MNDTVPLVRFLDFDKIIWTESSGITRKLNVFLIGFVLVLTKWKMLSTSALFEVNLVWTK